jgi:hypothetical protein
VISGFVGNGVLDNQQVGYRDKQRPRDDVPMRLPELIALAAFLVATATGFSAHAQTPDLECAHLPNVPDDGVALAVGLKALASKRNRDFASRVRMPICP